MKENLKSLSQADLVEEFLRIALQQYEALENREIRKYNRLFDQIGAVETALMALPGDQRRLLLALYEHKNIFVRLRSAFATKTIAPSAAMRVFKEIQESGWIPYSADAGFALDNMSRKKADLD